MAMGETAVREVHVAVAVIIREGRILIARRPDHVHQGGLLEFPGGKVEPGETVQQALVREIAEETGLEVPETSLEPVIGIRHDYGDKRVFLDVWRTSGAQGEAHGREGQPIDWLLPEHLEDSAFPAANRPIIRAIRLPMVMPVTGAMSSVSEGLSLFAGALNSGASPLVILRAPHLPASDYLDLASSALSAAGPGGVGVIVHGSPDVFSGTPGAAGLHLPWREAEKLEARPVPSEAWFGVSCHDPSEVAHAVAIGADYVTLGPVAQTRSHPGVAGMGWSEFSEIVSTAPIPVYGLGGLGPDDVADAIEAGAQGIAGISFWWPAN